MTKQIRPLGFTNSLQQLVWDGNNNTPVVAYLWGGGGGGGGNDSGAGGAGGGGGFSRYNFTVSPGDVIQVAVGGKGSAGGSRASLAPGGSGGASYLTSSIGYYGGPGGPAGPSGSSGGGGGGGGATVLLLNGSVVAIAGGGGGGGGAGNQGTRNGENAPGGQGQSGSVTNGGMGSIKTGDGGGGGGGGGGLQGGLGGGLRDGDQGAFAGAFGSSSAPNEDPSGRTPGGQNDQYYTGTPGVGGGTAASGTAGYAVFEFNVNGLYVHHEGIFRAVAPFVKVNNTWQPVEVTWVKSDGVWQPVAGSYAPEFTKITGNFGAPGKVCIGVCDENDATRRSTMNSNWNTFLSRFPNSELYSLQPGRPNRGMRAPPNFVSSGRGFGPIQVNRDGGNASQASDWFVICGLGSRPAGSLVEFAIDESGSMRSSTVAASINLLRSKCAQAGLILAQKSMRRENWIAPFI